MEISNLTKRKALFLFGCIPLRLLICDIAKNDKSKVLAVIAMGISLGFAYILLTGIRKTGGEVFGEMIWWNSLRPIHSLLYGLYAYSAMTNMSDAYKYLVYDTILGFVSFVWFHFL